MFNNQVETLQEGNGVVTVCIPASVSHAEKWLYRAVVSAYAQTVPVTVKVLVDVDRRYAAWARNRIAETVTTPFIVWLDADDFLTQNFVKETLSVWRAGSYVYTDMFMTIRDKQTHVPAISCYGFDPRDGEARFHHTTTLMPTRFHRALGGFDETLFGGEDTDYYLKMNAAGIKSIALRKPLMGYTPEGHYSKEAQGRATWESQLNMIWARYKTRMNPALCCEICE